jgi:Ca2+:H+ antiporter
MKWLYPFLAMVPAAIAAEMLHASPLVVFGASALAILPLSALLGQATEELAGYTGPTIGGLLNATLGNLAELIIAALALRAGLIDLVKASITGSILGNLLLVLGASLLAGGLRHTKQTFNPHLAGVSIAMLVIAVVGLVIPTLFLATHPNPSQLATTVRMSDWVAGLLILGYGLSLLYSMGTHRAAFGAGGEVGCGEAEPAWPLRRAVLVLLGAAAGIGVVSEILVGATEGAIAQIGLSEFFVGLIVVPLIGNAAEHSSAVMMALKNRMDLAIQISIGSSIQVALLIAPLLVLLGAIFGQPMNLAFQLMEVVGIALAVGTTTVLVLDAETNWLEGALLLIVYAILAVAFFFF